jgi:hypothetical protein
MLCTAVHHWHTLSWQATTSSKARNIYTGGGLFKLINDINVFMCLLKMVCYNMVLLSACLHISTSDSTNIVVMLLGVSTNTAVQVLIHLSKCIPLIYQCNVCLVKLISRSRVLVKLVKKFPAFYAARRFINMFTRDHHLFLCCVTPQFLRDTF